ncbi:flagellin N-terminal helical domain-containing protein [Clostridium hydrogenum]|uniref:flagellin N-terminal helical domain-containing protein n=1 Tax=Clostridium hydrogenum TaxID=2855764 RepID=UPI002E328413|nr:flagellin [Clostridium hydrogenum]
MIINHNNAAVNTNRILEINNKKMSELIEKLSSGCRINKAADDAAGLSISEKMKAQIGGLDQGGKNSQDGISLLQTADGGMKEIQDILQRCKELAVQSSNGTYNDDNRKAMQCEIDQLIKEADNISNNTKFNGLSLLSGEYDKYGNGGVTNSLAKDVNYVTTSGGVTDKYTYNGKQYASAIIDFSNINSAADVAKLVGEGVQYTCCTCTKTYSIKFVNGTPDTSRLNDANPVMEVDVSSITNGTDLANKIMETAYGQAGFVFNPESTTVISNGGEPVPPDVPSNATSFVNHYSQLAADGPKLYVYDDRLSEAGYTWPSGGSGVFQLGVYGEVPAGTDKFFYADIQTAGNKNDAVRIYVQNVTPKEIGIDGLLVDTQQNANSAIDKIDNAIDIVSSARAGVGAYQNRLTHTMSLTNNSSGNLQSAESKIRDVDVAKEAMEKSKTSILQQSAESILSQANKMPESVLDLMKQWGQGQG